MTSGGSLTDDLSTSLLKAAQEMMDRRDRKMRLQIKNHGIKGYVTTRYEFETLGTYSGFVFTAEFDHDGREIKARFITKPMKDLSAFSSAKWIRAPLFPVGDPGLN